MAADSPYVLGLDIGPASIGWTLLDTDLRSRPRAVRRAGVHLFEAGVDGGKLDPETALTRGREQSKAKPRRDARAMRRQTWRRARRKKKVLGALIRHGLLPEGDLRTSAAIDEYVKAIDAKLRTRWEHDGATHEDRQKLPYRLRAAAAVRPMESDEVGRALYHLAQRRGFLSNRKTPERDDDTSQVKEAIGDLAKKIDAHDPPTLGAYLSSVDPDEERLRARWTGREMYEEEFERIWRAQAGAHGLSDAARKEIYAAIFSQRRLRDQRHLVGRCSLTGRPRCPIALRVAQRFRVLQQVNHLRVATGDLDERGLTSEERRALTDALCREGDLTIPRAKKAAGLPRSVKFSIERGGEKRLVGHRTDARLREVFGDLWDDLTERQRDTVVEDVRSVREPDTLARIGRRRWGLDADAAAAFADVALEEGHSPHNRAALRRLVAHMEDGAAYGAARKEEFPEAFSSETPHEALPPVAEWDRDLRNPSVTRALTEVRKLVNAVIRRHGKPERIHIEMARDLKAGRSKRERINKRMRDREKERQQAAEAITRELGYSDPRRWQIEKWLLADECGWRCPFTGREFGARELMGSQSQFDVEHIWPFSQSLDNSFLNKTICHHEENRTRKRNQTPAQAYAGTPKQYEEILERVKAFKGDRFAVREKLRRFTEDIDAGFTNRHLTETRYIADLACEYLGLLYGGRVENQGEDGSTRRIITPSGGLTAWLRRGWGLDAILSDRDEKERNDHRHHAIDAIVVALADQRAIQRLAEAAERMEREGRERPFDRVDLPWDDFVEDAHAAVERVVVSHRQDRRVRAGKEGGHGVRGKLHEDTLYSREHNGRRRVSKELWKLSPTDVEKGKVVDRRALEVIRKKLEELGERDPSKAFQDRANLPTVRGQGGRDVPLRRVRIEVGGAFRQFGRPPHDRYAPIESNHHMAFYDRKVPGGGVERISEIVSLPQAAERLRQGRPVVDRTSRGQHEFAFTLANGEHIVLRDEQGERICRVTTISHNELWLVFHSDGRAKTERAKTISAEGLRLTKGAIAKGPFRKVHINYLGEVHDAGG